MKWTGMYFLGYVLLIMGVLGALWKAGVLASIGPAWTTIGIVMAIGVGVMIAVTHSGTKESLDIGRK